MKRIICSLIILLLVFPFVSSVEFEYRLWVETNSTHHRIYDDFDNEFIFERDDNIDDDWDFTLNSNDFEEFDDVATGEVHVNVTCPDIEIPPCPAQAEIKFPELKCPEVPACPELPELPECDTSSCDEAKGLITQQIADDEKTNIGDYWWIGLLLGLAILGYFLKDKIGDMKFGKKRDDESQQFNPHGYFQQPMQPQQPPQIQMDHSADEIEAHQQRVWQRQQDALRNQHKETSRKVNRDMLKDMISKEYSNKPKKQRQPDEGMFDDL